MKAVNFSKELQKKNWKVEKRTQFIEFYYIGLSLNKSWELSRFIKSNKWYFEQMNEDIKEQFRRKYRLLIMKEEKEANEYI